jgi:hypothetical protein
MYTVDVSSGVKWPKREADHSSNAEDKSGGAIPSLPRTSLSRGTELIKHRDKFAFLPSPYINETGAELYSRGTLPGYRVS